MMINPDWYNLIYVKMMTAAKRLLKFTSSILNSNFFYPRPFDKVSNRIRIDSLVADFLQSSKQTDELEQTFPKLLNRYSRQSVQLM